MAEGNKNYHWNELDISDWFKSSIEEELVRRKYKIVKTDVFVNICSRMNALGLVYTINIDAIKNNKSYILENFNTTSEYNDGLDGFKWFMDFFKEKEAEAILKFSKNVLELGLEPKREFSGVKNVQAEEKVLGETEFDLTINCSNEELIKFMTEEEMIRCWNGNAKLNGKNVKMANFEIEFSSVDKSQMVLLFKVDNWKEYSEVVIKLETIRGNTKIHLKQTKVPFGDLGIVKNLWMQGVFMPICMTFGFGIVN